MAYHCFEDLDIWKRACRIAVRVDEAVKDYKDVGLRDQMTRAAVSSPSNIAEGAERSSTPDVIRFLNIAKGSAAELRAQRYIAQRIGVLAPEAQTALTGELKQISAMLQGPIKGLKSKPQHLKLEP